MTKSPRHPGNGEGRLRRNIPIPPSFEAAAKTASARILSSRYGVGEHTIRRWRHRLGIEVTLKESHAFIVYAKNIPVPKDFRERAAEMHLAQLERHYGRTGKTIHRWMREAGIEPLAAPRFTTPETPVSRPRFHRGQRVPAQTPLKAGLEEEAAQFLRRFTFVFRSRAAGAADPKGRYWRYGNKVMTAMDLIARAERMGFDPDAWRKVA